MDESEVQRVKSLLREIHGPLKKRKPQVAGYVYFVQEENDGPIKIGWAANPIKRLSSMQSGNPRKLQLLGAIKTRRRSLERELHEKFSIDRLSGEWFSPSAALIHFIESPERNV